MNKSKYKIVKKKIVKKNSRLKIKPWKCKKMCNKCECDNMDQCSIVGYQPFGACCTLCVHYDVEHTCPNYEMVAKKLSVSQEKLFKVAPKEKAKAMTVSVEKFP